MRRKKRESTLAELGEADVHRRIRRMFPADHPFVEIGPGDDAAVVRSRAGQRVILTTDSLAEEVHFPVGCPNWRELGYKLVMVNASDVVAMGGLPLWFLSTLSAPGGTPWSSVRAFFQGMKEALARVGATLVGGDVDENEQVLLGGTMAGSIPRGKPLTLVGAKPGDRLFVTGTLGDSALGCRLLNAPASRPSARALIHRHFHPPYRGEILGSLRRKFHPTAVTDLSDGLAADLLKLCKAGKVAARVAVESLPIGADLFFETERSGEDPRLLAARGGEDYELLFTSGIPLHRAPSELAGVPVSCIGEIVSGRPRIKWFLCEDRVEIGEGFQHFKG